MEFKHPEYIVFGAVAVVAVVFFVLSFRKKEGLMGLLQMKAKIRRKGLKTVLLSAGLGLMVFALMGPQVFIGYAETQKTGMDIYVLMDTSKSMLVDDIKPDRLSVAKKTVEALLNNLKGDRVGFIPFASDAYIQMPLTDDYQLARMFLDVMDTDMISGGGTNMAAAIRLASDSFERSSGADRVIIIISDGEENDGTGETALGNIKDDRLRVYTIGVGTEMGGLVPVYDEAGNAVDYMKDEAGNPVTSRLNAAVMQNLARGARGSYYQASAQGIEVASLLKELSVLERDVQAIERSRRFMQLYQYFLAAGIALVALAWFFPERRAYS